MADESRQDIVEEKIEAVKDKYGVEALDKINAVCLEEMCISLAMLVDNSAS